MGDVVCGLRQREIQPIAPPPPPPPSQLRLYKSGRATLSIGGVPFDVSRGVARQMVQQVVAVVPPPPQGGSGPEASGAAAAAVQPPPRLAVLGELGATLCVVPDVEAIIAAMQRERRGAVPESYAAMAEALRSGSGGGRVKAEV